MENMMNRAFKRKQQREAQRLQLVRGTTMSCFLYQDPLKILIALEGNKEPRSTVSHNTNSDEVTKPLYINY